MSIKHLFLSLSLLIAFAACSSKREDTNQKLNVVTTTGMIADVVKNIGGDSLQVTALMGPGVDPHLYKATQGDLGRLQQADVIFYNGLHLEGKMGEVFEKLERIKDVIPVSKSIDSNLLLDSPIYQGTYDPHIWFDVSLWSQTIDVVLEELIRQSPNSEKYFIQRATAYRNKLEALHEWCITEIEKIPADKRILITAHDAFSYFGRAYDIEVRGLQGISTLSEFGLKDRVDLINFIVDRKIKAVFVETSVSQKNINAIVEGCKQKGHDVVIGGSLFSDAMGAAGTPEGTYEGMVRANVKTIVESLR
ncbi:manganese/zinc/iron transport system substrate-binding protein [Roseivirga pacifica]|uniref:Manganese/zinc/iron transport system substrate-binding protein n=1 Tax=Roseivirga pacifica TaxID=1267423 RepID=A0A1I0QHC7_9BACT|nr:zinc ABC transporter substrate-binding protein [Roseivirga pacifica]RKQ42931.1 manganese/zinc/iron transport system substrate-binding protein [Roseivirga pacifica]SEW26249.1 manganese/zinc/iron transport system substrate-binding protein [Roseivirga pacifica]